MDAQEKGKPMETLSKKEICQRSETIAYYSGFGGLEVKQVQYGIDDSLYCISNAWCANKGYHKLKIHTDSKGNAFVKFKGSKVPLNECILTGKEQTRLWE